MAGALAQHAEATLENDRDAKAPGGEGAVPEPDHLARDAGGAGARRAAFGLWRHRRLAREKRSGRGARRAHRGPAPDRVRATGRGGKGGPSGSRGHPRIATRQLAEAGAVADPGCRRGPASRPAPAGGPGLAGPGPAGGPALVGNGIPDFAVWKERYPGGLSATEEAFAEACGSPRWTQAKTTPLRGGDPFRRPPSRTRNGGPALGPRRDLSLEGRG